MNHRITLLSRRELLQAVSLLGLAGAALVPSSDAHAGERYDPPVAAPDPVAPQGSAPDHARSPLVLGYYPEWMKLEPDHLDFTLFTHICHAFAIIDKGGALRFPDDAQTQALIRAGHAKNTQVLLSLGGADSNTALCAQPTDALADALAQRITDVHYDGIDVDWEAPENADQAAKLVALVQALRKRLPQTLITMAVSSEDYSGKWLLTPDLLPYVDWLNVMTYDFCGPWCDTVLHNAPLPKVAASMDYWKGRGWPTEKLMLGIPDYGRRIRASHFGDPAPAGSYVGDEVSYNEVLGFIKSGWKTMLDADAQAPYLVKPEGGEMITYDDVNSVRRKGRLAHDRGLRGFFFWEITSDFDGATHVLARAARQGWDGVKS